MRSSLPSWECGLKYVFRHLYVCHIVVTPFVGVWIEILTTQVFLLSVLVTPFVGVWIEISATAFPALRSRCHSLRGSAD